MLGQFGPAPYAPTKAINLVIDTVRDKTLPTPVTVTVLERAGVEPSLARRVLASLKQLDLLDDEGGFTETLTSIKVASTEALAEVLAQWVRNVYAPILQYVEPTDPVQRIADQFRHYEPVGMRSRMVTLFLGMCVRAGLVGEMPTMPRVVRPANGQAKPEAAKAAVHRKLTTPPPPPPDQPPMADARERYAAILMAKAEAMESPDADLLDRIERVLGIDGGVTP